MGIAISACAPVRQEPQEPPGSRTVPAVSGVAVEPSAMIIPVTPPKYGRTDWKGIALEGVAFDSRTHRLRVIDQPGGPASAYPDAVAVARNHDALAVVNGGFFTPQGDPLGLVMSGGRRSGEWNTASSLGSGVWHEDQAGHGAVVRVSEDVRASATAMPELLQAGPLLLERGRIIGGLENRKHSARTILLWDGGQRWWMGITTPCTLAELAQGLASRPPVPWPPAWALNLDGGRSSELWVAPAISGSSIHRRPIWNRPVRNFLVLGAR